jgi:hypothetical protein
MLPLLLLLLPPLSPSLHHCPISYSPPATADMTLLPSPRRRNGCHMAMAAPHFLLPSAHPAPRRVRVRVVLAGTWHMGGRYCSEKMKKNDCGDFKQREGAVDMHVHVHSVEGDFGDGERCKRK